METTHSNVNNHSAFADKENVKLRFALMLMVLSSMVVACSNAIPTVTQLYSTKGDLVITPSTLLTSSWANVTITGTCSQIVTGVDLSIDGGVVWVPAQIADPTFLNQCNNKQFSISLSSSRYPMNTLTFTYGVTTAIQFRSHSSVGDDGFTTAQVQYVNAVNIHQKILVGTEIQTGPGLRVSARVREQQQTTSSGGSYRMKAWVRK